MNVKNWLLFLLLCVVLAACGGEEEGIDYVTTDSYLNKNNITDVVYLHAKDISVDENEILYFGNRKNKDWFALFDKSTGLLLKEWYGQERSINPNGLSTTSYYLVKKFKSNAIALFYKGYYISNILVLLNEDQETEYGTPVDESCVYGDIIAEDKYYCIYNNGTNTCICDFNGNILVKDVQGVDGFYIGFQSDKLWMGYYDGDETFKETCSLDVFERDRTLHLGYGEYKDVHIDRIGTDSIYHNKNGYVFVPQYYNESESGRFYCDVIFLNKKDCQIYIGTIPYSSYGKYFVQDWYEDSILLWEYDYPLFVFNMKGEKIAEFAKKSSYNSNNLYPVNYNEGVALGRRVSRWNLNDHTSIWETTIDKLNDFSSDARITFTLKEQNGTAWLVLCNVLNKDGSKNEFTFTLNIETGEITYTD